MDESEVRYQRMRSIQVSKGDRTDVYEGDWRLGDVDGGVC